MKLFFIITLLGIGVHAGPAEIKPAGPQTREYVVYSDLKPVRKDPAIQKAFTISGKPSYRALKNIDGIVVRLTDEQAGQYRRQGFDVEPTRIYSVLGKPDSNQSTTSAMIRNNPWGIDAVRAPQAQALKNGDGTGQTVCVVDTGVDPDHPALSGQVTGGAAMVGSGRSGKPEWFDDHGHGTHVAGTVAGKAGVLLGVAPGAKIYGVKVLDGGGSGTDVDVADGILACIGKAKVINLSLGSTYPSGVIEMALKKARRAGIQIACAAGNDSGPVGYPARYKECVAVSAIDINGKIAQFSSRGIEVDLAGPGVGVRSAVPGGGYAVWSGTSMATPHVAGVMAIRNSRSKRTVKAVKLLLKPTEQGKGRVDALKTAQ